MGPRTGRSLLTGIVALGLLTAACADDDGAAEPDQDASAVQDEVAGSAVGEQGASEPAVSTTVSATVSTSAPAPETTAGDQADDGNADDGDDGDQPDGDASGSDGEQRDDDDGNGDENDDDESNWEAYAVEPLRAPSPRDVTVPSPAERVECPAATVEVDDAEELTEVLAAATPGDVIVLAAGVYEGNFVATAVASAEQPIFLCGPADAELVGEGPEESGYVLHLDGAAWWRVVGLRVRDGRKGVMVDGGVGHVLQGLTVHSIGDEAIHLRTASTDNFVLDNTIFDTGNRRTKFGEGIYVGTAESNWCNLTDCEPDPSHRNHLEGNDISSVTSEAIDVKEGTLDGVILDNTIDGAGINDADSWIDIKGNGWVIAGNTLTSAPEHGIQTHEIISGWGSGNAFVGNELQVDAPGFGFDMHGPDDSNLISCENTVDGAGEGFANEECA